jgi:hypothetical protein
MRFMVMHKVDATMEAGGPPSQDIIQSMGALVQESLQNKVFTTGAGLHRSARRVRLVASGGEFTVTKGPYTGKNELVHSFTMIQGKSLEEAVERAKQFARVLGDVEIEIGPVVEPWDLGIMQKPAGDPPRKYLLLRKGDAATERGDASVPERGAAYASLLKQLQDEGVLLLADSLLPTAKGVRLAAGSADAASKTKRTWVDGPFAESKELIAGFSILDLPSLQDAITWADRYAAILGDNEVDIRQMP